MSDELPKCTLCGKAPHYHNPVGPDTWCDTPTCRLYRLPMTVDAWRRLHGPRLDGEVVGFDADARTVTLRLPALPAGLTIGGKLSSHGPRLAPEHVDTMAVGVARRIFADFMVVSHDGNGLRGEHYTVREAELANCIAAAIRAALAALVEGKP